MKDDEKADRAERRLSHTAILAVIIFGLALLVIILVRGNSAQDAPPADTDVIDRTHVAAVALDRIAPEQLAALCWGYDNAWDATKGMMATEIPDVPSEVWAQLLGARCA